MDNSGNGSEGGNGNGFVECAGIDPAYVEAVQSGKIRILVILTKLLGKKVEPADLGDRYLWKSPDGKLIVYLNSEDDFMFVHFNHELVCSTIADKWLWKPGPWFDTVVMDCWNRIDKARRRAVVDKLGRDMCGKPLVCGAAPVAVSVPVAAEIPPGIRWV